MILNCELVIKIMSYKVVCTIEDGYKLFSDTSTSWEKDGFLHWPKISHRNPNGKKLLQKLKFNQAEPEKDWTIMPCVLKGHFADFNAARDAAKSFSQLSTEDESK